MKKFEVGKTYFMRSPGMHDCVWVYTVTKRTAQTVTLTDDLGEVKTCRISKQTSEWCKAETVYPLGKYSLCPSLSADSEVEPETPEVPAPVITGYTVSPDLLTFHFLGSITGKINAKQSDFLTGVITASQGVHKE